MPGSGKGKKIMEENVNRFTNAKLEGLKKVCLDLMFGPIDKNTILLARMVAPAFTDPPEWLLVLVGANMDANMDSIRFEAILSFWIEEAENYAGGMIAFNWVRLAEGMQINVESK
jgi:type II restriction/modification system DNA methylase subunit YeeA